MPFWYGSTSKPQTHNVGGGPNPPGSKDWTEGQWEDYYDAGDSAYSNFPWVFGGVQVDPNQTPEIPTTPPPPPGAPPAGGGGGGAAGGAGGAGASGPTGGGGTPPPPPPAPEPPPAPLPPAPDVPPPPYMHPGYTRFDRPVFDPYFGGGGHDRTVYGENPMWGGSGFMQLAAAETGLMGEAERRQQMIDEAMKIMYGAIQGQLAGPAVKGLTGYGQDILENPYIMSSEALQGRMQQMARQRIANAAQTAKTGMMEGAAATGMAGGESAAATAGVDFRAASELAGALAGIEQEMAQRRTQERFANVSALGGIGSQLAMLQTQPQLAYAQAMANQINPELMSLLEMYSNMGGMYAAAGLNMPYTPWQLPASQLLGAGANLFGNLYASGAFNQSPSWISGSVQHPYTGPLIGNQPGVNTGAIG